MCSNHHHGSGTVEAEHSSVPLSGGVLEISLVQDPGPICQRDAPTERKCWAQAGEPSAPPQRYPATSMDCSTRSGTHNTLHITHTAAAIVVVALLKDAAACFCTSFFTLHKTSINVDAYGMWLK